MSQREPHMVVVSGAVRSRHADAMEAEQEAARLRSYGWPAYADNAVAKKQRQVQKRELANKFLYGR